MSKKPLPERLAEADVKLENIIYLQFEMFGSSDMDDLLGGLETEELTELFGYGPEADYDEYYGEVAESHLGKLIAQVSTPVKNYRKSGSCSYSWSYTNFKVIMGETLKDLVDNAVKFAQERDKVFRERAME